jgi:hypothetical protein
MKFPKQAYVLTGVFFVIVVTVLVGLSYAIVDVMEHSESLNKHIDEMQVENE